VTGLPALVGRSDRLHDFGVYVHVPFCRSRCGYCDFNTYVAAGPDDGPGSYAQTARAEIRSAARALADAGIVAPPVETVFVGGGTPTLLDPSDLALVLDEIRTTWGLASGAEVTVEANPDTVTPAGVEALADAGFTRMSVGMQSAVGHVLATLDRTHSPAAVPGVVRWAVDAGLRASVDLIYGTPGETVDDWRRSVDAALGTGATHLSAYALTVEPGTRMGEQQRRGLVPRPDPDLQAEMYELVDEVVGAAGMPWYEISNWAVRGHECRHNLGYWRGADWWGIGPGAHSHVDGLRWWNVKHPRAWQEDVDSGNGPLHGQESLDEEARRTEHVMLRLRLVDGLDVGDLTSAGRLAVGGLIADGLVDGRSAVASRPVIRLTRRGRLLADSVVAALLV
jgi:putative oxygen-independent coproporphyrinogen III oxidase